MCIRDSHSTFVGLDKFKMLFSDMTFIRVIRNTLAMGVINLVVTLDVYKRQPLSDFRGIVYEKTNMECH